MSVNHVNKQFCLFGVFVIMNICECECDIQVAWDPMSMHARNRHSIVFNIILRKIKTKTERYSPVRPFSFLHISKKQKAMNKTIKMSCWLNVMGYWRSVLIKFPETWEAFWSNFQINKSWKSSAIFINWTFTFWCPHK